ncbi:MAG: tetratricopeptide repeat protein [Chloroflexi bacterium]|nr:MAG: tetratricopeptide repeat protein [Chloroflexota bacterium]
MAFFILAERLLHKRWRLKKAIEMVRRGLFLDPESPHGHELLGRIELRRKRWKEAEVAYRKALAMQPQSWVLMNNLAIALRRQGRQREAIAMFENAARANPRSKLAQRNLYLETRRYVGVGLFAFILLINGARVLAGYFRSNPFGAGIVLCILASVMLAIVLIKWRRKAMLTPVARTFYEAESHRELLRTGPFVRDGPQSDGIPVAAGRGPGPDGGRGAGLVVCLALSLADNGPALAGDPLLRPLAQTR